MAFENISLPPQLVKFPTLCNHGCNSVYKHKWSAYMSSYMQYSMRYFEENNNELQQGHGR